MLTKEAGGDDDIVASGEALSMVAAWLGVSDVDAVMEQEGLNPEYETGRRQGLGLGAKHLPHSKAVGVMAGVEQRLKGKLKRSREERLEEEARQGLEAQPAGRRGFAAKHSPAPVHKHDRLAVREQREQQPTGEAGAQQQNGGGREEGEDSDEEEGRGRAFGDGKHASHKPAAFSRSDLLKVDSMPQSKKKKKRKSGTGQPLPASA